MCRRRFAAVIDQTISHYRIIEMLGGQIIHFLRPFKKMKLALNGTAGPLNLKYSSLRVFVSIVIRPTGGCNDLGVPVTSAMPQPSAQMRLSLRATRWYWAA
jgi:hypothetical protein